VFVDISAPGFYPARLAAPLLAVLVAGGTLSVAGGVAEVLESVEPGVEDVAPCALCVPLDGSVCAADVPAPAVVSPAVVSVAVPVGATVSVVVV
jgi:hypothetical protein